VRSKVGQVWAHENDPWRIYLLVRRIDEFAYETVRLSDGRSQRIYPAFEDIDAGCKSSASHKFRRLL
jgi:hypothetical protein